jgi:hypothetical protein
LPHHHALIVDNLLPAALRIMEPEWQPFGSF